MAVTIETPVDERFLLWAKSHGSQVCPYAQGLANDTHLAIIEADAPFGAGGVDERYVQRHRSLVSWFVIEEGVQWVCG